MRTLPTPPKKTHQTTETTKPQTKNIPLSSLSTRPITFPWRRNKARLGSKIPDQGAIHTFSTTFTWVQMIAAFTLPVLHCI